MSRLFIVAVALAAVGCATSAGTARRPGAVPFLPAPRIHIGICNFRQPEVPTRRVAHDSRGELVTECKKHYRELDFACSLTGGIGDGGRQNITCTGLAPAYVRSQQSGA